MADRKCIVCGKSYKFCLRCEKYSRLPRWMQLYHDENCKEIFETLSSFVQEIITKEEAREKLNGLDLSNIDNFKLSLKKNIDDVFKT